MNTTIENCSFTFTKTILEVNVGPGRFDRTKVKKLVASINAANTGGHFLVLVVCDRMARISLGGLSELGQADAIKYAVAKAYVIRSLHQRLMGLVFSIFFMPHISIKMFRTEEKARQWLTNLVLPD